MRGRRVPCLAIGVIRLRQLWRGMAGVAGGLQGRARVAGSQVRSEALQREPGNRVPIRNATGLGRHQGLFVTDRTR